MKTAEVRERKIMFITGLLYMTFFCFTLFFLQMTGGLSATDKEDFFLISGIIFGSVISPVLSLYSFWDYLRKRLILYTGHAVYFPLFGKKKTFSYDDIQIIQATVSGRYRILSHSGKVLARFDENMSGTAQALSFLNMKGIMVRSRSLF